MPPDGLPVGSGLALRLWRATEPVQHESLHCPFIIALGNGLLPRLAFQHYVSQDAIFLQTFARVYALALAKCDPAVYGDASFDTLAGMLRGVHTELRLHGAYTARWGVQLSEVWASPCTRAYTDFLLAVAEDDTKGLAHVLAAMAPCARLYAWLGCSLAAAYPGASHAYMDWVQQYSSEQYLAIPAAKESLLEHAAAITQASPVELQQLYMRAMQLEADFFGAHPELPLPRTMRLLVVDFDETCTQRDTSGKLLSLAAAARLQAVEPGPEREQLRLCQEQQLAAAVKNYVDKQAQLLARLLPPEPAAAGLAASSASTAAADMLDVAGLLAFLDQLSDFDVAMNGVVQDAGLLAGLRVPQDLLDAAQPGSEGTGGAEQQGTPGASPALQPGCAAVLQRAQAGGVPVHVLSVCWSADWVQAVLPASCGPLTIPTSAHSTDELVAALPSYLAQTSGTAGGMVLANSLHLAPAPHAAASSAAAGQGLSSGQLVARVQCARDKGRVFAALLAACGTQLRAADESRRAIAQHLRGHAQLAASPSCVPHEAATPSPSSGDQQSGLVVYVGDATSDLLPLLLADVGIVVGQNKLLRRVARTYGIRLQPLVTAPTSGAAPVGVLYEASSWAELDAFTCGPRSYEQAPYKARMQTVRSTWAQSTSSSQADAPPSVAPTTADGAPPSPAALEPLQRPSGASGGALPPRVLCVSGSDSGGGAGMQADLKTLTALGVFGASAVTALTAQNTWGVQPAGIHVPPVAFLEQQLDAVLADVGAGVIKTGMLPSAEAVQLVARKVQQYQVPALVVDPVMVTSSGHSLAGQEVTVAMLADLLPLATLITPNIPEAAALLSVATGAAHSPAQCVEDMEAAARQLHALTGCQAVLVKGGHLATQDLSAAQARTAQHATAAQQAARSAPLTEDACVTDVLFDGAHMHRLTSPRVRTRNSHGTGCTLAAAVAGYLAVGAPLPAAVDAARRYLNQALRYSQHWDVGSGPQQPFNHSWAIAPPQPDRVLLAGTPATVAADMERWPAARVHDAMRLYAVTDPRLNVREGRDMRSAVAAAVAGGATVVQIRDKDHDGGEFLESARQALEVCRAAGVPLVINDRVDIALALGPDVGVHVGQSDLPCDTVRRLLGPGRLLGVSCKTPEAAQRAVAQGADYVGCGAVYATTTKDSARIGIEGVAKVYRSVPGTPVVAIGGIGLTHIKDVMTSGASGVAVVTAIFGQPDVEQATRALRAAVDACLAEQQA